MPTILFLPSGVPAEVVQGESILQTAQRIGLPMESSCGGKRRCGKCKVIIEAAEGLLPPATTREQEVLGQLIGQGYRLACDTVLETSATVRIPEESRIRQAVILTSRISRTRPGRIHPLLRARDVKVPSPELSHLVADRERLLLALREDHHPGPLTLDSHVLRKLPRLLREGDEGLTVILRNRKEVIDVRARKTPLCGIAFDIGTTTVVGYLMDMKTGKILSVKSALNPQIPFGADVISRISHCQEHPEGLERLRSGIVECLNQLAIEAGQEVGIAPEEIAEASVVGNTIMHHLFLGLDPRYVARAPYPPVLQASQDIKARDLGLKIGSSAYVHLPPLKAGFVGSDTMACILATGIHRSAVPTLLLDLGTNGEIVFGNRERLICCSTAAGPAFEGGHIRWGMRASSGAIERVSVDPATLEVEIKTIDHGRPAGFCGSGIISAAAELIRAGVLLRRGNFNPEIHSPRLRKGEEGWEFVLSWASETAPGRDITLSQKDIAELVMAKAAVHAGASVLVEVLGGKPIRRILLAGALGNYVDPSDAGAIDLFPGFTAAKVMGVGNAAGHGSCLALLDRRKRREAEKIASFTEYQELAATRRFQELFVRAMTFTTARDAEKGI